MGRRVPNSPQRRTYVTGGELPKLTTDFRPIPLGRDSQGDVDASIRALAVLVRNRSKSKVYIREGPDTDDEMEIQPHEDYRIWEPNGVSTISLRGSSGGEKVEIRTLEAHNDFDLTDRIEAFARSVAHFMGTASRDTHIAGQDIDLTVGTVKDISAISDTVTIDDITATSTTFSVDGNVGIDDASGNRLSLSSNGNLIVDDITATSAKFNGDITGQTNFDLSAAIREGETNIYWADGSYSSATYNSSLGQNVADHHNWKILDPAAYDGRITRIEYRIYNFSYPAEVRVKPAIDYGDTGSWDKISPRGFDSGLRAKRHAGPSIVTPTYYPNGEIVVVWEPDEPPRFKAGDAIGLEVSGTTSSTSSFDIEIEVITTEVVTQ